MADKTIKERGLTTTTRQTPWEFSFDKDTRQLEIIYYYQYCVNHDLITVAGEQSRTSLILKTYNQKAAAIYDDSGGSEIPPVLGGYGYGGYGEFGYGEFGETVGGVGGYGFGGYGEYGYGEITENNDVGFRTLWSDAMRDWLQIVIPSPDTDLGELWYQYFAKYSTTPDEAGVTYGDLSVEMAYRKFLIKNISGLEDFQPAFFDQVALADLIQFKLKKFITDTVTLQDATAIMMKHFRSFADDFTAADDLLIIQKKFFLDTLGTSDALFLKLTKGFQDVMTIQDIAIFVRSLKRMFSDAIAIDETMKFIYTYRFADNFGSSDALKLKYKSFFADNLGSSDSLSKLSYIYRFSEPVYMLDNTVTFTLS